MFTVKNCACFWFRFDCLRRKILVAEKAGEDVDQEKQQQGEEVEHMRVVPGILRFYDSSTGLFGIRYSDGNR